MPSIIIIEKNGDIKEQNIKNVEKNELYKKAGLKTNKGFSLQTTWSIELNSKNYNIELYGKLEGGAKQENKYEFPPPVDSVLYFGNCILINTNESEIVNLSKKEWKEIYEMLYGGFEDLDDEDDEDDDEYDDMDGSLILTKEGYEKDGFVVDKDDTDISDEDEEEDDISSEEEIVCKKKKRKPVSKKAVKTKNSKITLEEVDVKQETYLNCDSELCEEEYV
jgi:hypothetical protein